MIRRPPRSTLDRSSAASDVYKRQEVDRVGADAADLAVGGGRGAVHVLGARRGANVLPLSLIHISEPTRPY